MQSVSTQSSALNGTWNRTNVIKAEGGIIKITNSNDKGFVFMINVSCGGNVGETDGYAKFNKKSEATARIDRYDGTCATFNFIIEKDRIKVETKNAEYIGGMGKDYEKLTFVMEEGTSYETELTYSGFIRGIGEGADLWIKEDGKMYCLIYEAYSGYCFYTNDENYKKKVPEEFGQLRDVEIKFIYVEPIEN